MIYFMLCYLLILSIFTEEDSVEKEVCLAVNGQERRLVFIDHPVSNWMSYYLSIRLSVSIYSSGCLSIICLVYRLVFIDQPKVTGCLTIYLSVCLVCMSVHREQSMVFIDFPVSNWMSCYLPCQRISITAETI